MLIWLLIIAGTVLLDQASKILVLLFLDKERSFDVIRGVFRFTYVENEGAAFGMLSEHRWVFLLLATLGIFAMLFYLWRFRPASRFACTALSLIIGGGIGNMIDRIFRSGVDADGETYYFVVDFLDFCAFPNLWQWVFNLADTFVCVGAAMLVLWLILDTVNDVRKQKKEDPRDVE